MSRPISSDTPPMARPTSTHNDATPLFIPLDLDALGQGRHAATAPPQGRSIVLVGLMGAGKTTIGRMLATQLNLEFVDSDEEIERAAGCSIADLFQKYGEAEFRRAFDLLVRIHEFQVQLRREHASDGGLARAHQPDQHDAASLWRGGGGMPALAERIEIEGDEQGRGVVMGGRRARHRGRIGGNRA